MLIISLTVLSQPFRFPLLRSLCLKRYFILLSWIICFLEISFMNSLHNLDICAQSNVELAKIFSFCWLSLCVIDGVLCCAEAFQLHKVPFFVCRRRIDPVTMAILSVRTLFSHDLFENIFWTFELGYFFFYCYHAFVCSFHTVPQYLDVLFQELFSFSISLTGLYISSAVP